MKKVILFAGLLLLGAAPAFSETPPPAAEVASNPEMKRIFDADQADRAGDMSSIDWAATGARDATRREETRRLLAEGQLHTGADFVDAAFVFQHGSGDDFLLAHTLAVIATKKGASTGPWIAAATLDRYLQSIGRKQIYGTQSKGSSYGWTNEPYDRDLISDALRRELGVPDLAAQAAKLQQLQDKSALPASKGPVSEGKVVTSTPTSSVQIKCDTGPINRIFVRATWRISSCSNGGLLAIGDGEPASTLFIMVLREKVMVTPQGGGNSAEIKVAAAAFEAMTPAQIADIIEQTRTVKP